MTAIIPPCVNIPNITYAEVLPQAQCISRDLVNVLGLRFNRSGAQCRSFTRKSYCKCCRLFLWPQNAFFKARKMHLDLVQLCWCSWRQSPNRNPASEAPDQPQIHFPRPAKRNWHWFQHLWSSMPSLQPKTQRPINCSNQNLVLHARPGMDNPSASLSAVLAL